MPRQPVCALTEQASAHLDMVRGLAAFAVLYSHWRSIFFVDWPQVMHRSALTSVLYGLAKFGHQAVVVFFVLSGLLIGRSVLKDIATGKWSEKRYALHRFIRLEIVLVPAVFLCFFWDGMGQHLFPQSAIYLGTSGIPVIEYRVSSWITPHIFIGNLLFLQTIVVPPFGSDNPLWSLASEFWYYVLFPCLAIFFTSTFTFKRRMISGICFVVVALFIGNWMFEGFFIWLLGVALVYSPVPKFRTLQHYWTLLAVSALAMLGILLISITTAYPTTHAIFDHILGFFVAFFFYALLHSPLPIGQMYKTAARKISGFSYTLYLAHMPFLVFCAALLNRRSQPSVGRFIVPLGILFLTVVYSYCLAVLFEHNTNRVRKYLEVRFR